MHNGFKSLDFAQTSDFDGAGSAISGNVIPEQIDDHHIFRAIFFTGSQFRCSVEIRNW